MPLRDHTKEPFSDTSNIQGIHGKWPSVVMDYLNLTLPPRYRIVTTIHMGRYYELDIGAFDKRSANNDTPDFSNLHSSETLATLMVPKPTLTLEIEEPKYAEYETKIFEIKNGKLVAAIEFVSPSNKHGPEARAAFAAKCAHLWRNRICVSILDIIVESKFNLYADTLDLLGHEDPAFSGKAIPQYAATMHAKNRGDGHRPVLDTWAYPMTAGQPLPKIPILLSDNDSLMLDLDETYEQTIRAMRLDSLPGAQ